MSECEHKYINSISGRCCVCGEKIKLSDIDNMET